MKRLLIFAMSLVPLITTAQSEWERPISAEERLEQARKDQESAKKALQAAKRAEKIAKKAKKKEKNGTSNKTITSKNDAIRPAANTPLPGKDAKYLAEGAVPEENGKVVFSKDIVANGVSAQEIYEKVYTFLDSISKTKDQIESGIVLFNKKEHIIAAKFDEWLTFMASALSLDRSEFKYTAIAKCSDELLHISIERISYAYESGQNNSLHVTAEEWITDKMAVNKKRTKLYPVSAKFRRKTIDRVQSLFDGLSQALKR